MYIIMCTYITDSVAMVNRHWQVLDNIWQFWMFVYQFTKIRWRCVLISNRGALMLNLYHFVHEAIDSCQTLTDYTTRKF